MAAMAAIHPTALVDPAAEIDESVEIGPFCIIEASCRLGAGCVVQAHAQICARVSLGAGCSVGRGTVLGEAPQSLGFDPATPSFLEIGPENVFREYVTVHRGASAESVTRIGTGNYFMVNSHVGHDCSIGDENVVANACLIAGHVTLGNRAFLGGGSVFHQYIRIGDLSMSQGNARLSQDVPPYTIVAGLNEIRGLNSVGLRRAGIGPDGRKDLKRAFQLLYRSERNLQQALNEASEGSWSEEAHRFLDFHRAPSRQGICRHRATPSTPR